MAAAGGAMAGGTPAGIAIMDAITAGGTPAKPEDTKGAAILDERAAAP